MPSGSGRMTLDKHWMRQALALARRAEKQDEVPVGAVLVLKDEAIGEGWNRPIARRDPTAHAEIMALRAAAQRLDNYRLVDTIMYVTLEPCVMCAGAIIHARVSRVVFGAFDPRGGAAGSVFDILTTERLNHRVNCEGGVLEADCGELLRSFFERQREKRLA